MMCGTLVLGDFYFQDATQCKEHAPVKISVTIR